MQAKTNFQDFKIDLNHNIIHLSYLNYYGSILKFRDNIALYLR